MRDASHPGAGNAVWALVAVLALATAPLQPPAGGVSANAAVTAGSPQRAIRPDRDGPYNCSSMIEPFKGTTKTYSINLKIFYPAVAAGENASANASGAPYPTVLQMPYAGSDEGAYDFISPRIVSWGFVCVVVGTNQSDGALQSGSVQDINEILDQLEADNATAGHNLRGMVDRAGFGIAGHSYGGRQSLIDGCYVPRLRAVQAMAPAIYQSELTAISPVFQKPVQIQVGRLDTGIYEISQAAFAAFGAPKAVLDLPVGHGGPFRWDLLICFFFFHLRGLDAYGTFLYGDSALDDASDLDYYLNFSLPNGSFFPPRIGISASALSPAEDQQVDFNASISGYLPPWRPNCTFNWDLDGDGAVDASGPLQMTANTSYPQARQARASIWCMMGKLRLEGNNTLSLSVMNIAPVADCGGDRTAAEDEQVVFNGSGKDTPSDLELLNYSWDFGDGCRTELGPAAGAVHAFRKAGNYTVRLTAQDDDGATGNASILVSVQNIPPSASAPGDMSVWKDSEAVLAGWGSDTPSDAASLEYRWDFGDGSMSDWGPAPRTTHIYRVSGIFRASIMARDDDGWTASSPFNVTVKNAPPWSWVLLPPDSSGYLKDEMVEFEGGGTDTSSDARSLSFCWDFGDGNRTDWGQATPAYHKYTRSGRYMAVLMARDQEGAAGNATVNLTVRNGPPVASVLSPLAPSFQEDEQVRFWAEADDSESDRPLLSFWWTIDGLRRPGRDIGLSFSRDGTHEWSLSVTDPEGAEATVKGRISVTDPAPRLTASAEPLRITAGGAVNFSACATDTSSDLDNLTFKWTFGDGSGSSDPSGAHKFDFAGDYTVNVTVEDDEGALASQSFTVTVDPAPEEPRPHEGPGPSAVLSWATLVGGASAAVAVCAALAVIARRKAKSRP